MLSQDELLYFELYSRAEAIRMLYAFAGKPLEDRRIDFFTEWTDLKKEQPLGQLPVYECEEGTMVMSNSIARYVAKKFGFAGNNAWEEALNDMVVETCRDCFQDIGHRIYYWKLFKLVPEPENSAEILVEMKAKIVKSMTYLESETKKRGRKFLIDDKISLADVWLYASLENALDAFPDVMEISPWVKEFVAKVRDDDRIKKYLAERQASTYGV